MEYQSFLQIVEAVQNKAKKHVLAIAGAAEQEVLEAARHARKEGIVEPLLVGDSSAICAVLRGMRENPADWSIEHAETGMEASVAVDLARNGVATALMKGAIETKDLLQPLVKKENIKPYEKTVKKPIKYAKKMLIYYLKRLSVIFKI